MADLNLPPEKLELQVAGEGLRYEIKDFVSGILSKDYFFSKVSKKENLAMAEVQERYIGNKNLFKL